MGQGAVDVVLARAGERLCSELSAQPDPAAYLGDLVERAREGRDYDAPMASVLAWIVDRVGDDEGLGALAELHLPDVYLAAACERGCGRALAAFERDYMPDLAKAIDKIVRNAAARDEIAQGLRTRLMVRDGDEPGKIATYSGRGRLFSWLRVVAVREALQFKRKHKREVLVGDAIEPGHGVPEAAIDDLELGVFKGLYRREFKVAFETAVASLEAKERAVLKLHLIDKLSIDAIGAAHDVHRTSAARWLRDVRTKLATATRDALGQKLELSGADLDSVMRLVRSRLELSVSRILGEG